MQLGIGTRYRVATYSDMWLPRAYKNKCQKFQHIHNLFNFGKVAQNFSRFMEAAKTPIPCVSEICHKASLIECFLVCSTNFISL